MKYLRLYSKIIHVDIELYYSVTIIENIISEGIFQIKTCDGIACETYER